MKMNKMPYWMKKLYWYVLHRGYRIKDLGITKEGHVYKWDKRYKYTRDDGVVGVQEWIDGLQDA